jgi:hypothetical protein
MSREDSRVWCFSPSWKSRMKTACCLRARVCCHCSTERARKRAPRDARALPPVRRGRRAEEGEHARPAIVWHHICRSRVLARVSSGFVRQPPALRGDLSETSHSRAFLPPTRCWPPCPCCAQRALSVAPLLACVRGVAGVKTPRPRRALRLTHPAASLPSCAGRKMNPSRPLPSAPRISSCGPQNAATSTVPSFNGSVPD